MLREASLRQLQKNPLRWLRNNVSDSHAQTIPPAKYEMEAWRIVHVMACRWLGVTVYLDPPMPIDWANVVWSRNADSESEDHAPIHDIEATAKARRAKAAAAKRARNKALNPVRFEHITKIIRPMITELSARGIDLPRPKVTVSSIGWCATWLNGQTAFVIVGELNEAANSIGLQETDDGDYTEFAFEVGVIQIVWDVFRTS